MSSILKIVFSETCKCNKGPQMPVNTTRSNWSDVWYTTTPGLKLESVSLYDEPFFQTMSTIDFAID